MSGSNSSFTRVQDYKIPVSRSGNLCLPNLKYHVFISRQSTEQLANHISTEDWGSKNVLLYKYLDYIWRFQLLDKNVKLFYCRNGAPRLVFHTNLTRKDGEIIYLLLKPNKPFQFDQDITQQWRVSSGYGNDNESFVTRKDLLSKYRLNSCNIPKPTFTDEDKEVAFNSKYGFVIDWQERIRTAKNRILTDFKDNIPLKTIREAIQRATVESLKMVRTHPLLVAKQVFMERKIVNDKQLTQGYHFELLIPITVRINEIEAYYAMVIRPNHKEKYYEGMSILTRHMAYANSRLLSKVELAWLKPFSRDNNPIYVNNFIENNTKQLSPVPSHASYHSVSDTNTTISEPFSSVKSISPVITPIKTNNNFNNSILNDPFSLQYNNNNNNNISTCEIDNSLFNNPFFYIATVLPLTLPKLKVPYKFAH